MDYQNIFNRDFFPTPKEVIARMLMGEDVCGKVILEPSAGSGNIVRYLQEQGARNVMACEINDTLRNGLQCEVIGTDFLKLEKDKVASVDYIVMNPPFTRVEEHIMHAYDIAPQGCTIVSLIPTSRFKRTYGTTITDRLRECVELHGSREDIGNVFSTGAERMTDADISIVRLFKPREGANEFEGFIFDDAVDDIDTGNGQEGLIKYDAVRDMVARYIDAVKRFDDVQRASKEINDCISSFSTCKIRFGAHGKDNNGHEYQNITRDFFRKEMQKNAWQYVFGKLNMQRFYTSVMEEKINTFIEQSEGMPFTMHNIYKVVNTLVLNVGNIMNECIVRAFDTICSLSAENTSAGEKWKTNSNYMVNKKFIVDYMRVRRDSGRTYKNGEVHYDWHLCVDYMYQSDRRNKEINDVYKALCYVAGKPIEKDCYNPFNAYVITKCPDYGVWTDFDWFRVKFFKKGTMHFEFLDEDVWYRFNQIAAKAKGWQIGSQTTSKRKKK